MHHVSVDPSYLFAKVDYNGTKYLHIGDDSSMVIFNIGSYRISSLIASCDTFFAEIDTTYA